MITGNIEQSVIQELAQLNESMTDTELLILRRNHGSPVSDLQHCKYLNGHIVSFPSKILISTGEGERIALASISESKPTNSGPRLAQTLSPTFTAAQSLINSLETILIYLKTASCVPRSIQREVGYIITALREGFSETTQPTNMDLLTAVSGIGKLCTSADAIVSAMKKTR